jgi:anaerobic selenocysteine-containing dehydrogenase
MPRNRVTKPSFCRACHNGCPVLVEVEDGRAKRVTGIEGLPLYEGYTCVKGRALPEQMNHPERLLRSLKRMPDGSYAPIPTEQLMDEVAERLQAIVARHGPAAVATFTGTMGAVASPLIRPAVDGFTKALGSPMCFDPDTIDQAGKHVARALHGAWMAPPRALVDPEVSLIFGGNPLISYTAGLPTGNPGRALGRWLEQGCQLIVVDPRRNDMARRAAIHLQARPGEDVAIAAALLRVILTEGLYDADFVADNVTGLEALRRAVEPFTPAVVAARDDVAADDLVRAARIFAGARTGVAVAGTGPNMAGRGTLLEYLLLNLGTVCGRHQRAGERVAAPFALAAPLPAKAQAAPPTPAYGLSDPLPGSGLTKCIGGMPTAGLAGAMLHQGEGRIRALISCGGNPALSLPDQLQAIEALRSLDLLVQVDIQMSATARFADYVVASKMCLEAPAATVFQELASLYGVGCVGYAEPWAQYTEAVVEPPPGSDLIEEWELYYGLARRMGLQMLLGSILQFTGEAPTPLDMSRKPATDDLLEILCRGGRIPLAEVKRHAHGAVFPDPPVFVEPKDAGWEGRLDVGHGQMMADLGREAERRADDGDFAFRLISRRIQQAYNSSGHKLAGMRGRSTNPAFMNPRDLEQLGVRPGDLVELRSARAAIVAVAGADPDLRRGVVSMSHGFGGPPERDQEVRAIGASVSRLLRVDEDLEPYVGQPRMSDVPVAVRRCPETDAVA